MFGQAHITARHVPPNTCCRHKPIPPLHDDKRVSPRPAYTPEHKSTWNYSYTSSLPPISTFPAARSKLPTTFYIGLERQKRWFQKKAEKWGNTGSLCLDKPAVSLCSMIWGRETTDTPNPICNTPPICTESLGHSHRAQIHCLRRPNGGLFHDTLSIDISRTIPLASTSVDIHPSLPRLLASPASAGQSIKKR